MQVDVLMLIYFYAARTFHLKFIWTACMLANSRIICVVYVEHDVVYSLLYILHNDLLCI